MADRLIISELDFDLIKSNLKDFLRNQSEFSDYDFDGSGLSILLDILAYNTHYQAYYLNMVANESFLDTALIRDSVVSHAKTIGYTPKSKRAPSARIDVYVFDVDNTPKQLTMPKGTRFLSNQIDGKTYNYVTLDDVTVTKADSNFYFQELVIYEGELNTINFNYDKSNNPKGIFLLPETDIDTSTIKVEVYSSPQSTEKAVYELATNLVDVKADSQVYFLQEEKFGRYQIYFGNDVVGKSIPDGAVVSITYLITNGTESNGSENFIITQTVDGYADFDITTVTKSAGGADRETIDSIKNLATLQYANQNRIVTLSDYELMIKKLYPNINSVSVWGGEDETPPMFGKVFISINPTNGYYISELEKQNIVKTIIDPKSVLAVETQIIDPDYLYISTNSKVQYNPSKTKLTPESLKQKIRQYVLDYKNLYLDTFSSKFIASKLDETINYSDIAIVGSETSIRVQKRFKPVLNKVYNYTIRYNLPLLQGSTFNKLTTSEFYVNDISGVERKVSIEEVPNSFTGLNSIQVLNPGNGYTSVPTVTVTGDGFGATAVAKIFLGRIQSIEITNPGIDYTKAAITITGGGGTGATASAIIDSKIGKLRTVYYTSNAERVVVDNVGTVDYDNGIINLTDINILRTDTQDGLIRLNMGVQSNILQSVRNTILTIDEDDSSSITVTLQPV